MDWRNWWLFGRQEYLALQRPINIVIKPILHCAPTLAQVGRATQTSVQFTSVHSMYYTLFLNAIMTKSVLFINF